MSFDARKRNFTEAARAAALVARRAKAKLPKSDGIEVFAVRMDTGYSWEIRHYGAMVLERGHELFATQAEAREAGLGALSAVREQRYRSLRQEPVAELP